MKGQLCDGAPLVTAHQDCWMTSLGHTRRHMYPVLLLWRVKGLRPLETGYGSITTKDATQVAVMTLAAWDLVCHAREVSGLQMAL